jgi:hypothetical protein
MTPVSPHYAAYTGGACIEVADTLPKLRDKLQAIWTDDRQEDVVVWWISERGVARVVAVYTHDGRQLEMDGYQLCWRYPPVQDAITRRLLERKDTPAPDAIQIAPIRSGSDAESKTP